VHAAAVDQVPAVDPVGAAQVELLEKALDLVERQVAKVLCERERITHPNAEKLVLGARAEAALVPMPLIIRPFGGQFVEERQLAARHWVRRTDMIAIDRRPSGVIRPSRTTPSRTKPAEAYARRARMLSTITSSHTC
jgi:hypothetical protein